MLSGVLLPASLLRNRIDDPGLLSYLDDIIYSAQRMADMVERIHHAVDRKEVPTLLAVDLNITIAYVVKTSRVRWQDEAQAKGIVIEVVTDLADVPAIRGTTAELESILLNLLLNAVDALPEGGTIELRTKLVENGVQLVVRDTGIGMDEETQRRVFEPFFTTKALIGTGLGLSTVHGEISRWGGSIALQSTLGQGTTFTLCFPAHDAVVAPEENRDALAEPVIPGRLLVVEDDAVILRTLDRLLADSHQVELSSSGAQALAKFEPGRYDAVLIDLGLPELSGDQIAQAIRQADAAVAIVLISGWRLSPDDARLSLFDFHLQKPFDLQEVISMVNKAIAHARRSRE